MKLWTLCKVLAAFVVIGVLSFACILAWHVTVKPQGGVFERMIPASAGLGTVAEKPIQPLVPEEQIPEIDPGESLYLRGREDLALGQIIAAREKFQSVANRFPQTESAARSRRILSEMNLDELLSLGSMKGKIKYQVKSGDSYLGIAAREKTTLENLLHLNAMMRMRGLRPEDEMIAMALNGTIRINIDRRTLAVREGEEFLCEFPILSMPGGLNSGLGETSVASKSAYLEGKRILPDASGYVGARKTILIKQPALRIEGAGAVPEGGSQAILLSEGDMEELNLLVRSGSVVEFR